MIVITLTYVVPIERIDELRSPHLDWLREGATSGRLLVAGRQVPPAGGPVHGGMIIARGTRDEVKAWAATDPFAIHGAAEYSFVEVAPSVMAPGLEALDA